MVGKGIEQKIKIVAKETFYLVVVKKGDPPSKEEKQIVNH